METYEYHADARDAISTNFTYMKDRIARQLHHNFIHLYMRDYNGANEHHIQETYKMLNDNNYVLIYEGPEPSFRIFSMRLYINSDYKDLIYAKKDYLDSHSEAEISKTLLLDGVIQKEIYKHEETFNKFREYMKSRSRV
jgi:hypothetical protein